MSGWHVCVGSCMFGPCSVQALCLAVWWCCRRWLCVLFCRLARCLFLACLLQCDGRAARAAAHLPSVLTSPPPSQSHVAVRPGVFAYLRPITKPRVNGECVFKTAPPKLFGLAGARAPPPVRRRDGPASRTLVSPLHVAVTQSHVALILTKTNRGFLTPIRSPSAGSRETAPRLAGVGPSASGWEPAPWIDPKHPPPCARWPGTLGS